MKRRKSERRKQETQTTPVKLWKKEKSFSYRYAKRKGILSKINKQLGWD